MTPVVSARPTGLAWIRSAAAGLTFRKIVEADMPFLHEVYGSTRKGELDLVDWSAAQKDAFIEMQFKAQHTHYQLHHPEMDWLIIAWNDRPAGRLYLEHGAADQAIVDISLLPAHRGRGLGMALLRDILDEARSAGRSVSIHVEKLNPAIRLYRRLGFVTLEDRGIYDFMRWRLDDQVNTAS